MDTAVVAWSGGKDATYALHRLVEADVQVVELLTTITGEHDRSSMHGVPREIYPEQAASLGIPLETVTLPPEPSNAEYESLMGAAVESYVDRGIDAIAFGDLFLTDIRSYRESMLDDVDIEGRWPIWGTDTGELVADFLSRGFRATVVAVDGDALDAAFVGRELDERFLRDLPAAVDPCGENGEFHTFVWDGPGFAEPVPVDVTGVVTRTVGSSDVHYADLRLTTSSDGR